MFHVFCAELGFSFGLNLCVVFLFSHGVFEISDALFELFILSFVVVGHVPHLFTEASFRHPCSLYNVLLGSLSVTCSASNLLF
jgi:hypothetical protein